MFRLIDTQSLKSSARIAGQVFLVRYADDFVIGFSHEADARQVMEVLPKRFEKYGLTLHPDKTRLVPFMRPSQRPGEEAKGPQPGTFDLLGFTHFWGRTRRGGWAIVRQTASNRLSRAVKKIAQWCRGHRHLPVAEQHVKWSQKLRGHDAYYGLTGNSRMLQQLRLVVKRIWRKWLARRRAGPCSWESLGSLWQRYPLPRARVVHSIYRVAANP